MKLRGWNPSVQHHNTKIMNISVNRIAQEYSLYFRGKPVNSVKNRRHVHQQKSKHIIKIRRIPEEHIHSGEDKPKPYIKNNKAQDRIKKHDKMPAKADPVYDAEQEEYKQRQQEIYERRNIPRQYEKIFRDINLRKN